MIYKKYNYFLALWFTILLLSIFVYTYIKLNGYNSNRIYNIRKIPPENRVLLIYNYIDNIYKKNSILVLGDSQSNGHCHPKDVIFSNLLQYKLNINVINLAFKDSRIYDNTFILKYLKDRGMKFKAITFNLSPSHLKDSDFKHLEERYNNSIYDILKNIKFFFLLALSPNPVDIPDQKLSLKKYRNYIVIDEDNINSYFEKLSLFIEVAKKISDEIFIYNTQYSSSAMTFNDEGALDKLKSFAEKVKSFCKKRNIHYFDPKISGDDFFIDIVHFNIKGHQKMTEVLEHHISQIE